MEVEVHHESAGDSFGKSVGVQTAILAVLLSIFTIFSHRAHTDTIAFGNAATNTWSHYQAKRIRDFQLEMNTGLIKLLAPNSTEVTQTLAAYSKQMKAYDQELEQIKASAEADVQRGELAHHKASFFDLAEGILEIAVILSSLYFLSRKKFFPLLGLFLGLCGTTVGALGLLVH